MNRAAEIATTRRLLRGSLSDFAVRETNARANFAETLAAAGGISEGDAIKVMNLYLKSKLAKLDRHIGRISVKHGAYLDRDVIRRAVEMAA